MPVYNVTDLAKEMQNHIPKGAFARLITYQADLDKARAIASNTATPRDGQNLDASEPDFFKRSPMLMSMSRDDRRLTDVAVKRQAVREKMLSKMTSKDIALNLVKQRATMVKAVKKSAAL